LKRLRQHLAYRHLIIIGYEIGHEISAHYLFLGKPRDLFCLLVPLVHVALRIYAENRSVRGINKLRQFVLNRTFFGGKNLD
jgi:hypothetical protein